MVLHLKVGECLLKDVSSNDLSFAPAAKEILFFFLRTLKNINPCRIHQVVVVHPDAIKITVSFFKAVSRFNKYKLANEQDLP